MIPALIIGWAVLYADRTALYPLLSIIADTLGLSSAEVGFISSSYFFFYVLMQIPSGFAVDRWGAKRVLIAMFAISGLGLMGLGFFGTTFALHVIFSSLHGFGAGGFYPCCFGALLSSVPPHKRGVSSGLIGVGMALGIAGGMAVSGPMYQFFGNFRTPFLVLAIPTLLMLIPFAKYLPRSQNVPSPSLKAYMNLFRDWDIWKINLSTFTSLYGFWVAATWGPTFLQAERGVSLSQSGFYTGLIALTALPGGIVWGRLSDRLGRRRTTLWVLPVSAAALFAFTKLTHLPAMIAMLLLFGFFSNTALTPVSVAWIGDIVAQRHPGAMGAAVGFFNGVIMSAAMFAPLVSGFLRDVTGSLVPAFTTGCVLMAGGTILLFFIPESVNEKQSKGKEA